MKNEFVQWLSLFKCQRISKSHFIITITIQYEYCRRSTEIKEYLNQMAKLMNHAIACGFFHFFYIYQLTFRIDQMICKIIEYLYLLNWLMPTLTESLVIFKLFFYYYYSRFYFYFGFHMHIMVGLVKDQKTFILAINVFRASIEICFYFI